MKIATVRACIHPGRNIRMEFSKPWLCAVSIHCHGNPMGSFAIKFYGSGALSAMSL